MTIDIFVLSAILMGGLVTWLPRFFPFILTKYKDLPPVVVRFLNYIPISIIFALILSSIIEGKKGEFPSVKWLELTAILPTVIIALKTKNILLTVIVGIIAMAILRYLAFMI